MSDGPSTQQTEQEIREEFPPLDRGTSVGRYLVLGLLGQGGMGQVYAAYDSELDRRVALKVLRSVSRRRERADAGQQRLLREAQAMARVSHPNVIPVFDVGAIDERVFVAMELIDGPTLQAWLAERPRSWREIIEVFRQAGSGLAAAHAAGLVHRDFKPENVLVGRGGRIFVTDFGLARLSGELAETSSSDPSPSGERSSALTSPLTVAGAVMGTPQYMSPEQHLGRVPDARSDQFSFCAALHWALYKERPFDPVQLAVAAIDAEGGSSSMAARSPIREPPRAPGVPPKIRRAIQRGLSLSPVDRFESMDALLTALHFDPWPVRRRMIAAVSALVLVGVSTFAWRQRVDARAQLCTGGPTLIASSWNDALRTRLASAFSSAMQGDAARPLQLTTAALDAYAGAWTSQHRQACEATHLRGEQSEEALSTRMRCLDRLRKELGNLTSLLASADAPLVSRSVQAIAELPPVEQCADVSALTEQVPLPSDPKAREAIASIDDRLAEASALRLAGRYPPALEKASEALEAARSVRHPPTLAAALYLHGFLLDALGKRDEAEQRLREAIHEADVGRDDRVRSWAANRLLFATTQRSQLDDAKHWARVADAALQRLGGDAQLEAELSNNQGVLALAEGRHEDALSHYEHALRLIPARDEHAAKRAMLLSNLSAIQGQLGDRDEAVKNLRESIAALERLHGSDHPTLAGPLSNLAYAEMQRGEFASAHASVDRALEITRLRSGDIHRRFASFLDLKATIFQEQRRFEDALATYRRALELKQQVLKSDDVDLSYSLDGVGQSLLGLGRAREALAPLQRALAIRGPDPEAQGDTRFALARALWTIGSDRPRARRLATEAHAYYRRAGREDRVTQVSAWILERGSPPP